MNTMRRKVRDQVEAKELLSALSSSGRSMPEFCAERGIDGRSLQCWRVNLARGARAAHRRSAHRPLRLVELGSPPPMPTLARPSKYRVVFGDAVIEVEDSFEEETLARLLRVVSGC